MKLIQNLDNNNCYYIDSNSGVIISWMLKHLQMD
jgi:hypothetical protein